MRLVGFIIAVFSGFIVLGCAGWLIPSNQTIEDPVATKGFAILFGVPAAICFYEGWRLLRGRPASVAPLPADRDSGPGGEKAGREAGGMREVIQSSVKP